MTKNRCYNCKFFACQDTGYSNWTVEETEIYCLKKHFNAIPESYSWRNRDDIEKDNDLFKKAETCQDYKFSETQAWFDVDGETTNEDYKDDKELYEAILAYEADLQSNGDS